MDLHGAPNQPPPTPSTPADRHQVYRRRVSGPYNWVPIVVALGALVLAWIASGSPRLLRNYIDFFAWRVFAVSALFSIGWRFLGAELAFLRDRVRYASILGQIEIPYAELTRIETSKTRGRQKGVTMGATTGHVLLESATKKISCSFYHKEKRVGLLGLDFEGSDPLDNICENLLKQLQLPDADATPSQRE
ncbi:MAG: hypothetical protein WC718_10280 [Phycisphaerales bacterium]|jgi:hypothetical protein